MAVEFARYRNGEPTGETVWADEPDDIYGEGPMVDQQRRHALAIIARMDDSNRWQRVDRSEQEHLENLIVRGPSPQVFSPRARAALAEMERTGRIEPRVKAEEAAVAEPAPSGDGDKVKRAPVTQAVVRAWAQGRGIEVNPTGRVPKKLIDQYLSEHEG